MVPLPKQAWGGLGRRISGFVHIRFILIWYSEDPVNGRRAGIWGRSLEAPRTSAGSGGFAGGMMRDEARMTNARTVSDPGACVTIARQPPFPAPASTSLGERWSNPRTTAVGACVSVRWWYGTAGRLVIPLAAFALRLTRMCGVRATMGGVGRLASQSGRGIASTRSPPYSPRAFQFLHGSIGHQ